MFVPDKADYLKEMENYKLGVDARNTLEDLYDYALGIKKVKSANKIVKKVLSDMFPTNGMFTQPHIPLSLLETAIGKTLFHIMFGMEETLYTITDIREMTKSPERPDGLTRAWISLELDRGNLKGTYKNNRWYFTESQIEEYFNMRGYKRTK